MKSSLRLKMKKFSSYRTPRMICRKETQQISEHVIFQENIGKNWRRLMLQYKQRWKIFLHYFSNKSIDMLSKEFQNLNEQKLLSCYQYFKNESFYWILNTTGHLNFCFKRTLLKYNVLFFCGHIGVEIDSS